ncbi:MAG TPA: zinc-binding alcohol dehydrogenase family protein [Solirubrobacteraceae bacterium]|nr:zinc-binding alcohol dehydrogenase family protein [Solirubrobacteraceae bacterium]
MDVAVKAAVLHEYGVPRFDEFEEPAVAPGLASEQAVVEVLAAGLNPVDVAISAGRFYAGRPPLPSVAGREGVGRLAGGDGGRVYFDAPILPFGSMAERALIDPRSTYAVPDGLDDGVAVSLGISGLAAWLALAWRARVREGEHVLVLGASGVLGQIAVQGAKLLGAARVVAAARSREGLERCLALGADAAVPLDEPEDLAAAFGEAAEGRIDVVLDPLFGAPFAAALGAASFGARIVQIGASAGAEATVPSAPIRGKMLVIMGHTNFAAPPEVKREAYERMAAEAVAGRLRVETEPLALERVGEAWARLAAGSHRKIVLVP